MKRSVELINQLIQMEETRDRVWKELMISVGRGHEAVGESAMLTHLKSLRGLVEEEGLILSFKPQDIQKVIEFNEDSWPQEEPIENVVTCGGSRCLCTREPELHIIPRDGGGETLVCETDLPDFPRDGEDRLRYK